MCKTAACCLKGDSPPGVQDRCLIEIVIAQHNQTALKEAATAKSLPLGGQRFTTGGLQNKDTMCLLFPKTHAQNLPKVELSRNTPTVPPHRCHSPQSRAVVPPGLAASRAALTAPPSPAVVNHAISVHCRTVPPGHIAANKLDAD